MTEGVAPRTQESEKEHRKEDTGTNGELNREEKTRQHEAEDRRVDEKREKQKKAEQVAKEAKKRIEEAKVKGEQKKIVFKEAKIPLKIVSTLQDETQVKINPEELKTFKNLLIKYGHLKASEIEKLTPEQIVIVFQVVARKVGFEEPKEEDFAYKGEVSEGEVSDRALEKSRVKSLIRQAENPDEETLTVDKVEQYLGVEEFESLPKRGGPGTTAATDWRDSLPDKTKVSPELRRYIEQIEKISEASLMAQARKLPGVESNLLNAIHEKELTEDANSKIVEKILEARIDELKLAEETRAAAAEAAAEVEGKIISEAQEKEIREFVKDREDKIKEKYNELNPKKQDEEVGEIERRANSYYKQIISGFGIDIPRAKERLLAMAIVSEDKDGYKRWRAVNLADSLDTAVRINQIFETPIIWQETPKALSKIYSTLEATDLSIEEMSTTVNQAINMIRNIVPDTREGRKMRDDLIHELEAFRGIHSLRIQLERHDMDPQNFIELYRGYFDDETLVHFVKRFARDEQQREFKDKHGKDVNLLDVSFELYSEQLRQERIKMNIVEEMTRHAIANPFSESELRSFEKWLDIDIKELTPELRSQIRSQIEDLRQHFVKKMQAKINDPENSDLKGNSVDDIWGRKKVLKVNEREIWCLNVTHDVIEEWYKTKTLQGAFGIIGEKHLDEFRGEFGPIIAKELKEKLVDREPTAEEVDKELKSRDFLVLRKAQLLGQLEEKLREMGLVVESADGKTKPVDFEVLKHFGTLESVDRNAYFFAWMMEWSTYDSIRIYSRDSKSKLHDDYDHLVFHAGSNLFFGRQIDQTWEFLHEQNENRGRPKENDVNRIWKSFLPGKHSWVFPQNGAMTRWADFFMTKDQADKVERRTREMMKSRQWDFDNQKHHDDFYTWMRNVVKRDMIESGEISFGKGAGMKLSEVAEAEKLRKFEFIDLFVDRASHKKFTDPPILQDYLANPTEAKFREMNDKVKGFYSTRDARQFPWMTLALRAHWEVASHHRQRLFNIQNMSAASGETLTDILISEGDMERKQGEKEKRKWFGFNEIAGVSMGDFFGTGPFRWARRNLELMRRLGWESKLTPFNMTISGLWEAIVAFFKQLPKELSR